MGSIILASDDLAPAPFPAGLRTIDLDKISLTKLLARDGDEVHRVTKIMRTTSFFMVDLLDHPSGVELYNDLVSCAQVMKNVFTTVSVEEKMGYLRRQGSAVLDKGYTTGLGHDDKGQPIGHETMGIPGLEMLRNEAASVLPPYLMPHEKLFRSIFTGADAIAQLILEAFEIALEVPDHAITASHDLHANSGHTIRVLRYPALPDMDDGKVQTLAPHRDWTSLTMLATWLGGLQIPAPDATWLSDSSITEESWMWVRPVPGTVIVNAGEALQLLTGGVVKAGVHRVVNAPGEQARFDKMSVFCGYRPRYDLPMKPYESPLIPKQANGMQTHHMTCEQWGADSITKWIANAQKEAREKIEREKNGTLIEH